MASTGDSTQASKCMAVSVDEGTGVTTASLNHPPVNALSLEVMTEICDLLDRLEAQGSSGLILTSSLATTFSAGLQLTELLNPDAVRLRAFWTALQNTWTKLYGASFPTVAVVTGHAPAGGCLLALCCDYRVIVNSHTFHIGLSETRVGLPIPTWVASTMEAVIGKRQAELALTSGRLFLPDQALTVGLVDEVAGDKAEGIVKAQAFLRQMGQVPALARRLTKLALREDLLAWMKANQSKDLEKSLAWIQTPDFQKGLGAYVASLRKKT